jgi:hypothetical protein
LMGRFGRRCAICFARHCASQRIDPGRHFISVAIVPLSVCL